MHFLLAWQEAPGAGARHILGRACRFIESRMRSCRLLAACLIASSDAVRRLDLMATEGEAAGKYAFEGGEPEATCKACKAVMEHIQREMSKPYYDEYYTREYVGKSKRSPNAKALNRVDRVNKILDPTSCRKEMNNYDLGYVGGANNFVYKPPGGSGMNYPVHMELNEWAKNELGAFCESLFEEYEEQLTEMLMEDEASLPSDTANMTTRVCKEQLQLCQPPPPPPPPKKKKKEKPKTRKQLLEQARSVFNDMDSDGNGHITRDEMMGRLKDMHEAGKLTDGQTPEGETDRFFASVDKDKNGKVTFYEYKFMWVDPKNKMDYSNTSSEVGLEYYVGKSVASWIEMLAPELAASAPGALVGGLGVTILGVCVGGRAVIRRS